MRIDFTRELALNALYKIEKENAYSNIVLDEILESNKKDLDLKDKNLISELVYGVTAWRLTLDTILEKYSKLKLNKISIWVKNIIRMGIYQIVFLDKIPKSAAVNESVNLSKKYAHKSSSGFINAILRKVEKSDYEELKLIQNDMERLSKVYSMPMWILEELFKDLNDFKKIEDICKFSNVRPNIAIRVNNLKTNIKKLKEELKRQGILFEEGNLNDFIYLKSIKDITNLDLYKNGYFILQDESAGLASIVLSPKEGEYILDACSAPGGKTTYLAELTLDNSNIEAWDIYENRLEKVKENANRLGIKSIKTKIQDASLPNEELNRKFDKILLDVPCLGIGVIKRKPDIKWQRKKEDIIEISKIQSSILETCSKYLKPGGELVYSTCSILKDENEKIVNDFLRKNKDFQVINCSKYDLGSFKQFVTKDGFIKIYQNAEIDGFFIAKLVRKK